MPIILSDNIEPRVPKPLDNRIKVDTYELLDTITYKYDSLMVWVVSEEVHYRWQETEQTWVMVNLGQLDIINGGYF